MIFCGAMLFHSFFLMTIGFVSALIIFLKMVSWQTDVGANNDVKIFDAWRALLFGLLIGVINYFAGNITKNSTDEVMLAMGFDTHEYSDETIYTVKVSDTAGNESQQSY